MKKKELITLGVPTGKAMKAAFRCLGRAAQARMKRDEMAAMIVNVDLDGEGIDQVVDQWMQTNESRWKGWIGQ